MRTYGKIVFNKHASAIHLGAAKKGPHFMITDLEPHVAIKLKGNFEHLRKYETDLFAFPFLDEMCHNLLWFLDRYPLEIDIVTQQKLKLGRKKYLRTVAEMEEILGQRYVIPSPVIKDPYKARHYQVQAAGLWMKQKKMLLCDDMGLGKSLSSLLGFLMQPQKLLPGLIVCETHLTNQWKRDMIEKFTTLRAYIIPVGKIHKLPDVDVYIITYSRLTKWIDILCKKIKSVVFDEVQQLRVAGDEIYGWSDKYTSARNLCSNVHYAIGLSGTPIYNYGIEIFNILDCLHPGCLGERHDFTREYGYKIIKDATGLGSYLRERYLLLRRTTTDVERELPPLNTVITDVEWNDAGVEDLEKLAAELAQGYLRSREFAEKGEYARELDMRMRHMTGVGKAPGVAATVKILLENDHPVLLSGWHHDVYGIWMKELEQYNPVLYTGKQSPAQKDEAKRKFMAGESKVMIISNRSGAGLDGLQYHCRDIVIGELDWSPKVHDQLITRLLRDGQEHTVNVYYPLVDEGSDPVIVDVLALKTEQAHMIVDPMLELPQQKTDDSRIKLLAENFLKRKGIALPLQLEITKDGELQNKKLDAA